MNLVSGIDLIEIQRIEEAIVSEPLSRPLLDHISPDDLFRFFKWMLPRVEDVPHPRMPDALILRALRMFRKQRCPS